MGNTVKVYRHTVQSSEGMHARPAGMFVKLGGKSKSTIEVQKGEKRVNVHRIMAVMGLCIKQGESIEFYIEGEDEDEVLEQVAQICRDAL